jgi:hypothetical protein
MHQIIDKPILFPYTEEEMHQLFFDEKEDEAGNIFYTLNPIIEEIIHKIDCTNVSFKNVKLSGLNLENAHNIKFNPQEIYNKDLNGTVLGPNIYIIGNDFVNQKDLFDQVKIRGTNFNGCQDVIINPQTIYEKELGNARLKGVNFSDYSFDECNLWETDFQGSKGAKITPDKVKNYRQIKSLKSVRLLDLPTDERYSTPTSGAINYQDIEKEKERIENEFKSLIEEQLPKPIEKPLIEETMQIEPPKQKKKWFQ